MATGLSKLSIVAAASLIFCLIGGASAYADVATDGTVGPRVRLDGPEFEVGADLGTRAGRNLFHSFERFSLSAGERATFSGPDQIRNVISRVTGGERSDIDGTIRSTIAGADFYFLNPAGVVFGPNASLDLQGSFHVSTADEARFPDGAKFSATNPAASSFTVAAPEAFGFLGSSPTPILVDRSVLEVPIGKSFSIVGGDITIRGDPNAEDLGGPGTVRAEAGQITLAAVRGPGQARLGSDAIDADRKADVSLTDQALVDASGNGGGSIYIRGSNFVVANQSFVFADNDRASDAVGGVDVEADRVQIIGGSALTSDVRGTGNGGTVSVRADELEIADRGKLTADTHDTGSAGVVAVIARDIEVRGGGFIRSSTFADGAAGAVTVDALRLQISRDGSDRVTGVLSEAHTAGNGGRVFVIAQDLNIGAGGEVSSSTFGEGNAGDVAVVAQHIQMLSGGRIATSTSGDGQGGLITVSAIDVSIRGGVISSEAFSGGDAGSVRVEAERLLIRRGHISTTAATDSSVDGGQGNAGRILILAADRLIVDDASITASSTSEGGGSISIRVGNLIDLHNSELTASAAGIDPVQGNILIDPQFLIIDGSRILANAPAGLGGNIVITAENFLISFDSILIAGTTDTPLDLKDFVANDLVTAGLVVLDKPNLDASNLLRARCGVRRDIGASSFIGVGRGGLPPSPDGPLASAHVVGEPASGEAQKAVSRPTTGSALADVRLAGLSAPCAPLD